MKVIKWVYFKIKYIIRFPLDILKKNNIHSSVYLSSNTKISRTSIGPYCYIANNVNIINADISSYCSIAPGVQIGGMEHSYWWLSTSTFLSEQCISNKKTKIGYDVWIAAGSIIKQGVKIGDGSVIGAMSFVNKDIPPNSIAFGVPAKIFKKRMDPQLFEKLKKSEFWNYPPEKAKNILEKI